MTTGGQNLQMGEFMKSVQVSAIRRDYLIKGRLTATAQTL